MINITSKMVIKHWSSILLPNVIFRYGVKSARFVQGTDVYSYITSFPWNTPNTTLEKDLHYQIRVVVGVQSLSHVWLFLTRWTAVYQAFLSFTISLSLLKLMSIDSVNLSNHLILHHHLSSGPQSFSASGSCPVSQFFTSDGQSSGASASASVLPMHIQGWLPLGLTSLIPCCPKDSQESSPAPKFKSINS